MNPRLDLYSLQVFLAVLREGRETPLLSFGIFDAPATDHPLAVPRQRTENEPFITEPKAGWDLPAYRQRFDRLHRHLREGDCYQANLTMPIRARWKLVLEKTSTWEDCRMSSRSSSEAR